MSTTALSSKQVFEEFAAAISGHPKTEELIDKYVNSSKFKEHILQFEAGFPGYQIDIHDLVSEGNLVALRGTFLGTHDGTFAGIPPTGKQITAEIAAFYQIEDQKISDFWLFADTTKILNELRG